MIEINGVDITPIISAILEIILGLLTTWFSTKAIPWIKEKLNKEQLDILKDFVRICVRAAEQIYPAEQTQEKFEYVLKLIEEWLAIKHLKFDTTIIRAMIEAAVIEMKKELYPEELAAKRLK